MQKVICINDKHWHTDSKCPLFGEITSIEKSFACPSNGEPVYSFIEYPSEMPGKIRCFSQKYFAPLTGLDETELVTEEFNEKYCVPVNSDYRALKAIRRGGNQAIEDKAIAEYMKAYEERGKEEAERIYFEHFKKKP